MKEANIFEAWAERLIEGTWQLPDTPEKQQDLLELMSKEQPVGADATNITEQLYGLLGDDHLFDQLEELAERDANADARQVIFDRMQELSSHPDVLRVIEQLNIDPTAEMNPPEGTPADLSATPPEPSAQVPGGQGTVNRLAESKGALRALRHAAGLLKENVLVDDTGSTFQHILDTYKRDVKDFEENDEMSQELHDALYDYYFDDMPYGVQKARTGDPYEWVADRFAADLGHPGAGFNSPGVPDEDYGLERESVMHGDYAEEARDPHSVDGGMENPLIQDESEDASLFDDKLCNMSDAGEHCPVHGVEECWANSAPESSPLAGQYGHSGKMKEVGKETSFLDRLKELSGMIRN